jgi:RNA polymerase sigma factor (sigma-70 family)
MAAVRGDASDEVLMVKYQRGDREAFALLVRRYSKQVYNFVLRQLKAPALAEDVTQDVFMRLVQNAAEFKHEARFSTWLYAIARNLCIDQLRRMQHRRHPSLDQPLAEGAGRTLGLEVGTLNANFGYPARTANQLTTLNHIDTLTPALTLPVDQLPVIPDPFGSAPLAQRARAYLHSNCSYCHRPGGTAPGDQDFRYTTALAQTNTCDITPSFGNLGIADPRRIAPGSAARSVVVARVDRIGADAMPPLARHVIDTAGVQLLTTWVNGLSSCN